MPYAGQLPVPIDAVVIAILMETRLHFRLDRLLAGRCVAGAARLKILSRLKACARTNSSDTVVVGLAGTGDTQQTTFSNQSLTNILERMGVAVSPTAIRVKNTAAVMVTATLPALPNPE